MIWNRELIAFDNMSVEERETLYAASRNGRGVEIYNRPKGGWEPHEPANSFYSEKGAYRLDPSDPWNCIEDLILNRDPFEKMQCGLGLALERAMESEDWTVQVFHVCGWEECRGALCDSLTYRAFPKVPMPRPKTKPSWPEGIKPEYKWLARWPDGRCMLYTVKPNVTCEGWCVSTLTSRIATLPNFIDFDPGTCDWRESLIERPS